MLRVRLAARVWEGGGVLYTIRAIYHRVLHWESMAGPGLGSLLPPGYTPYSAYRVHTAGYMYVSRRVV